MSILASFGILQRSQKDLMRMLGGLPEMLRH
jgi:hypothetical protein